jgi:hypothetical protein
MRWTTSDFLLDSFQPFTFACSQRIHQLWAINSWKIITGRDATGDAEMRQKGIRSTELIQLLFVNIGISTRTSLNDGIVNVNTSRTFDDPIAHRVSGRARASVCNSLRNLYSIKVRTLPSRAPRRNTFPLTFHTVRMNSAPRFGQVTGSARRTVVFGSPNHLDAACAASS